MPPELSLFLQAWSAVAAAALPAAAGLWLAGGRGRLCPRWRPMPFRGTLMDFVVLYFCWQLAAGVTAATALSAGVERPRALLAGSLAALPTVLAVGAMLRRHVHELPPERLRRVTPRDVAVGLAAGVAFTPAVHAAFAATRFVNGWLGGTETPHSLAAAGVGETPLAIGLFFAAVCVAGPWVEELLFRGLILRWVARRREWAVLTLVLAGVLAVGTARPGDEPAAATFVAGAAVVAGGVELVGALRPRTPTRTLRAAVATSALFAAAHMNVWPTPVPLFLLACGLAYLTLRTGTVAAAVAAHGVFNAVSTLILVLTPPA